MFAVSFILILAAVATRIDKLIRLSENGFVAVGTSAYFDNTVYVADQTNARVVMISTTTQEVTGYIPGFHGAQDSSGASGPNGIAIVEYLKEVWVSDASTIKIINASDSTITATIPIPYNNINEIAASSIRRLVVVTAVDGAGVHVLVFIDASLRNILAEIKFHDAPQGIFSPIWNPTDFQLYLALLNTSSPLSSVVAVVDGVSYTRVRSIIPPLKNCNAHAISFGYDGTEIFVGCNAIQERNIETTRMLVINTSPTAFADNRFVKASIQGLSNAEEVVYNNVTRCYYIMAPRNVFNGTVTPLLGIVPDNTYSISELVPVSEISRTVASDGEGNLYVPYGNGVGIFN